MGRNSVRPFVAFARARVEEQPKGYQGQLEESLGQKKGSEGKPEGSEGELEGSEYHGTS